MNTPQDSLVDAAPDQGRTVSVDAVAGGWAAVEVWQTGSGMHHLAVNGGHKKPMLCGRIMRAVLDDVCETADELSRLVCEPANAPYLCSYCSRNARRILPPNKAGQGRA